MKKILFNIVFKLLLILLLGLSIILNKDYSIINNRIKINNEKDLNNYKDYKYVTLNLKDITETRFAITDNNKARSIIYIVKYGSKSVLVELNKSTVITKSVDVLYNSDTNKSIELKLDLNSENDNKYEFINGYYSNVSLSENENIIKIKFNITIGFCLLLVLLLLGDFTCIFIRKNK